MLSYHLTKRGDYYALEPLMTLCDSILRHTKKKRNVNGKLLTEHLLHVS